jgi:hypothetical protein
MLIQDKNNFSNIYIKNFLEMKEEWDSQIETTIVDCS